MSRGLADNRYSGTFGAAAAALLLLLSVVALFFPLRALAAAEQHLFDPNLSLTGTCSTDEADTKPDPWCPGPPGPSAKFESPNIAIDSFGDMYVSSRPEFGSGGRVDVFSPEGEFITELQVEGAAPLAVDNKGNLYVNQLPNIGPPKVTLFRPSTYSPATEEISYAAPGEVLIENEALGAPCSAKSAINIVALAVDPVTEHLFVSPTRGCVGEWSEAGSSAADGPPELLDPSIGVGVLSTASAFVAVDAAHNRLYVTDRDESSNNDVIYVFELAAPHALLGTLDGHKTPAGKFLGSNGWETIDTDETTGNLIVSQLVGSRQVFEFGPGLGASEELLNIYEYAGFKSGGPFEVAVDNAPASPNFRNFYVPSRGATLSHTFAFQFSEESEPEVESASVAGITETEAVVNAVINPGGGAANYRIEYTTQSSFEGATIAVEGSLPAGIQGVPISAPLAGLTPNTSYRFRVSVENNVGVDQFEGSFRTQSSSSIGGSCPNESLRTGFSADLPDCRAYELVSPADTNGLAPHGAGSFGLYFPTLHASPDGSKATFRIEGGTIPGFEAAGSPNGDNYLASRGANGWMTELAGPTGTDAITPAPGAFSPDQGFSFWIGEIDLTKNPFDPHIRYPDGHSEPVGRGSLGIDPEVEAELISQNGSHTLFKSIEKKAIRLEPDAPPPGTAAIYDRTSDEATHVVSLLPGDVTPGAGENAVYLGASLDGEGVAFEFVGNSILHSNTLYLRQHDATTYEIGKGLTYAGIAEGGGRIFYLQSGNLFAFDTSSKSVIQFSKGGDTTPVNVSDNGSIAYFVSPDVLTGKNANPNGAVAQAGEENLYVSNEGNLGFVGTVEPLDVEEPFGGGQLLGLGQWVPALLESWPAIETSRTTADGNVLLFESRAPLTDYDPNGHTEIYRYDFAATTLTCLSCNPTGAPATGNASLQTIPREVGGSSGVLGLADKMLNIRPDGNRAFFQSYEPLVLSDVDGKQDVYEWEAQGVGSCAEPGGCIYLISSGESGRDEHLFAASESGDDAFFLSGNLLLGSDQDTTLSIYDARVGGGFPEEEDSVPCQGEGCRSTLTPPPSLSTPATPAQDQSGNVSSRRCSKGKRKVKRHGKVRCVKKHTRRHHRHHRKASKQKQAAKGGAGK